MFSREPKPLRHPPAAPSNTTETRPATLPAPAAVTSTNEEPCVAAPRSVDRRLLLGLTGLTGLAVAARIAKAGPLNPPPGPIQPTGKPLSEIEPRTALRLEDASFPGPVFHIERNGSYYLTASIGSNGDNPAILITASAVTLDLNGFTIEGNWASRDPNAVGIDVRSASTFIRNGIIKRFAGSGIRIGHGPGHILEDLVVKENGGSGIHDYGHATIMNRIQANHNADAGIDCREGQLRDVHATGNNGAGFRLTLASATDCVATLNGICGFSATSSRLQHCSSIRNPDAGFLLDSHCVVTDCSSLGTLNELSPDTSIGFDITGKRNRIESCSASNHNIGFIVRGTAAATMLVRNASGGNGTPSTSNNYNIPNPAANPAIAPIITNLAQATNPFANIEG